MKVNTLVITEIKEFTCDFQLALLHECDYKMSCKHQRFLNLWAVNVYMSA